MIFFNSVKSSKLYQLCLNDLGDRVSRQTDRFAGQLCEYRALTKISNRTPAVEGIDIYLTHPYMKRIQETYLLSRLYEVGDDRILYKHRFLFQDFCQYLFNRLVRLCIIILSS